MHIKKIKGTFSKETQMKIKAIFKKQLHCQDVDDV